MKRREFITLLGGTVAAWPLAARTQQPKPMRRLGLLMDLAADDPEGQTRFAFLRRGLQQLGWIEEHNLRIFARWGAVGAERVRTFAKEIVASEPDVLFTTATATTASVLQQTRTIPTVFVLVADPIGAGFVANLSHPGANATGFTNLEPTISTKWLELLKEVAPSINRVALLYNPETAPFFEYYLSPFKTAAPSLGMAPIAAPIHDKSEIEAAIASHAKEPNGALVVIPDAFLVAHRAEIVSAAAHYRIPAIYFRRLFTDAGGLLSYGFDLHEQFRLVATYIDKIFNGEKASDLPVQGPSKFELVINLKTAKALGLTVPPTLLTSADEVIE